MPDTKTRKARRDNLVNLNGLDTWRVAAEVYGQLFRYMKPYRWRFYLGAFLGVIAGMFAGVMMMVFRLIFRVVLPSDPSTANPADAFKFEALGHKFNLLEWLPSSWSDHTSVGPIIIACLLAPTIFLVTGALNYMANYLMLWVSNRVLLDLRNDTYSALLSQSVGYFSRAKTGNLVQTVFNQARVAQMNLVTLSQDIIKRPVAIASILAFLFYTNWHFTLYSLVVFPLCILPVASISRKVRKAGTAEEIEAGQMMVQMTECFTGIRIVKSYAREDYERERFRASNSKMNNLIMRYSKAMELVGSLVETVASFGVGVGLFYAWKTGITSTDFMVMVGSLTQIYPHAKALSRMQLVIQKTIVATSTIFSVMEEVPEVTDAKDAVKLPRVQGRISLRDVSFTYRTSRMEQRPAVQHMSMEMEPGKYYALVGPSGAGKSTLFALLQRFYDVDSGSIEVDGHDVRKVTQKSLRDNFGVVSQDVFLFHDSIYENIRYGRLDATREEIIMAAKEAHAHEFIMEQENQYETVIGDKGCRLSGGQQQRVSIARAILRNAPILLLDEATSALDTESEKIIQDAIHTLSEGKTVIAIAHRLSTILEADKIVVMDQGCVLDIGTHTEMLQRCEMYQRLYQLQFKGGNVDPDAAIDDVPLETESDEEPQGGGSCTAALH